MGVGAYFAEAAELLVLDVVVVEADLLLVPVVDGLQFLGHKELADLLIVDLDVLPSVGFPYLEDEVILPEAQAVLFGGDVVDAVEVFVLDADDGSLILGCVLPEGLDLGGLAFDEDADAVFGDGRVAPAFESVAAVDDFVLLVGGRDEGLAVGEVELAASAEPVVAVLAFEVVLDVVVVVEVAGAAAADEGLVVALVLVLAPALVLRSVADAALRQVLVDVEAAVVALPDVAQLSQRTEDRTLQLVEVVVEHVGLLCELVALLGDR